MLIVMSSYCMKFVNISIGFVMQYQKEYKSFFSFFFFAFIYHVVLVI